MAHLGKLTRVAVVLAIACSPTGLENTDGARGSIGSTPLPCSVKQILEKACYDCHGAKPKFGAPMSLLTWEDMHQKARTDSAEKVFQRINVRIDDRQDPMPPPPKSLTQGERDHLHGWIAAGAPAGDGCGVPPGTGGTGGISSTGGSGGQPPTTGGAGGVGGGGTGGTGGYGGTGGGIIEPGTCEPVQFLAHNGSTPGDTTPYFVPPNMPNNGQDYRCFYFKAPWNVPTQALRFSPIIDNDQVLHHWLLYATTTAYADGSQASCFGVHSDGTLLAGWAPGSGEWIMPNEVGMELPTGANANLVLEIHYYNPGVPDQFDRSGVEVCATSNLRPNTATVSWLGTEGIFLAANSPGTATGTCTPQATTPITIIRSWPHMHKLGRGMKADVTRAAGGVENLFDVQNYDFDYQISYETPMVINPGDRITTTCSFQNTTPSLVTFGPATEQEMCYNFVIAYPANALRSAGLMGRSCML